MSNVSHHFCLAVSFFFAGKYCYVPFTAVREDGVAAQTKQWAVAWGYFVYSWLVNPKKFPLFSQRPSVDTHES